MERIMFPKINNSKPLKKHLQIQNSFPSMITTATHVRFYEIQKFKGLYLYDKLRRGGDHIYTSSWSDMLITNA